MTVGDKTPLVIALAFLLTSAPLTVTILARVVQWHEFRRSHEIPSFWRAYASWPHYLLGQYDARVSPSEGEMPLSKYCPRCRGAIRTDMERSIQTTLHSTETLKKLPPHLEYVYCVDCGYRFITLGKYRYQGRNL